MTRSRLSLAICLVLLTILPSLSQTTVRGRVSDENGLPMIGVSVFIKEVPSNGIATDLDGQFIISVPAAVSQTLVISFISYETIEDMIQGADGEVIVRDYTMQPVSMALEQVEVVAKQEKRSQYYMESVKKKSASTLDYMSGDLMNKIGDNNVAAAIARVTGVSTNGAFITVRGLGDRYVQTSVNGSLIPTLDPFTNNIKLDLFPASFVDNIVITKTASPDLQGDWSAAYISIETKDNPDRLTIAVETKFGYVPQTTFRKIIANETSSTDWLGYDNGFRDVDHRHYEGVNASPTTYEEFCALGLENYFRSIGVTESWDAGSQTGETYFRLGLVELGLLGKAYLHDEQAASKAKYEYNTGAWRDNAFSILNANPERSLDDFANNWDTFDETAFGNFTQTISIGNQTKLFGKPFSFLGGFRYGSGTLYDPESSFSRTISTELDSTGQPLLQQRYQQEYAKYINGWTGLLTGQFKLNANNSFTLMFMPNILGSNQIREGVDQLGSSTYSYAFIQGQFYEERAQYMYQYSSDHYLESSGMRLRFSASYADGESTAPDFKSLQYFSNDLETYQLDKTISNVRRNFRYLDENILDLKGSLELPLQERPGYVSKLKFGVSYLDKDRDFVQYDYLLQSANGVGSDFKDGKLNEYFADDKFDIHTDTVTGDTRIDLFYRRFNDPSNHTFGYARVWSGFGMIDHSIGEKWRASGGLRAEYSDIFTDVKLFYDLGYAAGDLRRNSGEQSFTLNPADIEQLDFLPSVNLIYKLKQDEIFPSNLRMNYSRTVARPSTREYTETIIRDFELNADVFGNADLKFVYIDNYDVRYENYFASGDYFSASLFYKNFKNHIELTSSNYGFTWSNADKSYVYGVELEGRVGLTDRFEFRSNISLVNSYTQVEDRRLLIENGIKTWEVYGVIERTMFGQAPYVCNAILNYFAPKGFNASLSYNLQGHKLVLTSIDQSPDVYEMPRQLLNLKIAQPLGKHFGVSLTIKDILNAPVRRAYKYDQGYIVDFDEFRYGTEYAISFSYTL